MRYGGEKPREYVEVKVYVPKSIYSILKSASDHARLPVSKLIVFAIDNELDASHPFNYPTELPVDEFVPFAFAEEASKILNHLRKFPGGLPRDALLLMRRDIGLDKRSDVLGGYRELLKSQLIEEFIPQFVRFDYGADYTYARALDIKYNSRAVTKRRNAYKEIIRKGR